MLDRLSREDRLLLLKFVCAFAWTDLEITDAERRFVKRLVERAGLSPEDAARVDGWLAVAPAPSEVDPRNVPKEHRRVFLDAVRAMVYADGKVEEEERQNLDRLKAALESA
ncbi:MAG TPA: TerB family tellurite resistance protein [Polyangiaceae bacterium]|nr:TerB family tellurite resistance protein [Polyangiaceae bacterium]